jgi:drug/metabolite transporter (DMT)-like permease
MRYTTKSMDGLLLYTDWRVSLGVLCFIFALRALGDAVRVWVRGKPVYVPFELLGTVFFATVAYLCLQSAITPVNAKTVFLLVSGATFYTVAYMVWRNRDLFKRKRLSSPDSTAL